MNRDQLAGLWRQMKGRSKIALGDLTGDPDKRVEGTTDALYGRLQEGFGNAKQDLARSIRRFRLP